MKKSLGSSKKSKYIFIIIILSILMATSVYFYSSDILHSSMESALIELAEQGAETVTRDIEKYLAILETLAKVDDIQNPIVPVEEKLNMLKIHFTAEGLLRVSMADLDGNSKTTDGADLFIGDRDYFLKAKSGAKNVSDPMISRVDGNNVVVFAVPVNHDGEIVSVLYATYPVEELSLITDKIKFGGIGNSFIINGKGTIISHDDRELVHNQLNLLENPNKDPELEQLINLAGKMVEGKSGAGEFFFEGTHKFMGYAPIRGTEWSLGVAAPRTMVFHDIDEFIYTLIISSVIVVLAVIALNIYINIVKEKLHRQKLLSQNAIDTAEIIIASFDKKGVIIDFNSYAEVTTGYKFNEVVQKKTIYDLIRDEDRNKIEYLINNSRFPDSKPNMEFPLVGKEGNEVYILWSINKSDQIRIKDNIEIMGIDISDRVLSTKQLQEKHEELNALYEELTASEEELKDQYMQLSYHQEKLRISDERYKLVVEASNIGIWDWDMVTNLRFYSDKWFEIFGIPKDKYPDIGDLWIERIHPDDKEMALGLITEHLNEQTPYYEGEYRILTDDDSYKWVYAAGKALWDNKGNPYRMAGAFQDITQEKLYEEKIKQYAYFDVLTGLPNRISFTNYFNVIAKNDHNAALIFMDLDNFKFVNDSYGHTFGDKLLIEVGKRLSLLTDHNSVMARLGGDEYGILLLDIDDQKIKKYCDDLINSLDQAYEIENIQIHIGVSMGISKYPDNSSNFEELLKYADIAMYKAKEMGKNRYIFYTSEMKDELMDKVTIQNQIRSALKNEEFVLYYQPQFNTDNKTITGFEALVRWNSPILGMVSPLKFIGIAEENRMIIPLGEWILKTACTFIKEVNNNYSNNFTISVNISMIQILQEDFVDTVLNTLDEVGLESQFLELELTESILMQSYDMVADKLQSLKKAGVKIALDDFGKGYSSLSYLRNLPISTLKIDKSFIDNIQTEVGEDTLTECIIYMGKKMGLLIVAEGVETQLQLDYLAREKCDRIQGYLLGKPIPGDLVKELFNKK